MRRNGDVVFGESQINLWHRLNSPFSKSRSQIAAWERLLSGNNVEASWLCALGLLMKFSMKPVSRWIGNIYGMPAVESQVRKYGDPAQK